MMTKFPWWRAFGDLMDLVLPLSCAGCGKATSSQVGHLCELCQCSLSAWRPIRVTPTVASVDCLATGAFSGPLRECLIAYKDHGRLALLPMLEQRMGVLLAALSEHRLVCVPIPARAKSRRHRGFDHVDLLLRRTAMSWRKQSQWQVRSLLRAHPRVDSVGLSATERIRSSVGSFSTRDHAVRRLLDDFGLISTAPLLVVDDIITTGSTLSAATTALASAGVPVAGALVIAATSRRSSQNHTDFGGDICDVTR